MKIVRDLMQQRQTSNLIFASPYDTVARAIQKMSDFDLGAILVIENEEVVGVFSERDYARKLLLKGKSSLDTHIHEVMITRVNYVTPEYSLEECLALMIHKRIRHLPVFEKGKVIDLVSMDRIASALLEGKKFEIDSLLQYISGSLAFDWKGEKPVQIRELVWHRPFRKRLYNTSCA